jgi:hypothetical protein
VDIPDEVHADARVPLFRKTIGSEESIMPVCIQASVEAIHDECFPYTACASANAGILALLG